MQSVSRDEALRQAISLEWPIRLVGFNRFINKIFAAAMIGGSVVTTYRNINVKLCDTWLH
jgi:hypothetical protein